jgi:hypothetical protein
MSTYIIVLSDAPAAVSLSKLFDWPHWWSGIIQNTLLALTALGIWIHIIENNESKYIREPFFRPDDARRGGLLDLLSPHSPSSRLLYWAANKVGS